MVRRRWLLPGAACLGLVLAVLIAGCSKPPRTNLLLVTLDTTRADYLGCYGRTTAQTPNLDQLAAEGVLFEHAISSVPVTLPSHSTILTGLYPPGHGVRDNGLFQLPSAVTTLAEMLAAEGYRTGAAVGAYPLSEEFGIGQGFEFFDDRFDSDGNDVSEAPGLFFEERRADAVNDALLPWLESARDEPFFAWVHYFDPHHPHNPPAPYDQLFRHDPYQGELAFADQSFASLRRQLERWGVWDRTLVIVVGDHGEGRGQHGEDTHSLLVYDSTLRVPFLLRPPVDSSWADTVGQRVDQRVGTVDIVPTVLELLGLELPTELGLHGRPLVSLLGGAAVGAERRTYYAEALTPRLSQGLGELRAYYEGDYKYIHGPRSELFDLGNDPAELNDLLTDESETASRLRQHLELSITEFASSAASDAAQEADDESRRKLEALGYITGGGGTTTVEEVLRDDGVPPHDHVRDNSLMSLCKQLLQEGDYLAARDLAQQLVERAPDTLYYRSLLVMALLGLNDVEAAAQEAENALGLATMNEGAFLETIRRLFSGGEQDRARALLERQLEQDESGASRYLLGEMYRGQGQPEEALQELERALELEPNLPQALLSAAVLRSQADAADPLVDAYFQTLLGSHPLNSRFHFNYGVALSRRQDTAGSLRHLRRAVELSPRYCRAQSALLSMELVEGDAERIAATRRELDQFCSPRGGTQAP